MIEEPQIPNTSDKQNLPRLAFQDWFEYPIRVQPHHTDYAGIAWHGSYIAWMEEARVEDRKSVV